MCTFAAAEVTGSRPNIVLVLSDDMGYGQPGFHGGNPELTPNMDQLAGEETRRIHALDTNERTVAEALREAGYVNSIIGKWHCGEWLKEHLPMQQGFMHQYGHYAWGIDYNTFMIPHNAPAPFRTGASLG